MLLPGTLNITSVDSSRISSWEYPTDRQYLFFSSVSVLTSNPSPPIGCKLAFSRSDEYPLMPFLHLLLLRLQAWQHHGVSAKLFMRDKLPTDVRDILKLIQFAEQKYVRSDITGITANIARKVVVVGSDQPISD